jgi:hypothetical protein
MAAYSSASPYYETSTTQFYLDVMVDRPIPKETDDNLFQIIQVYQYRPDLLAFDLYDDAGLWWVFYQRNPNTLIAPPCDFAVGLEIYIPKITTIRSVLGS